MTICRGECGHIKSHWDNHVKCIKCSSCSRETTCSMCSSCSDQTWKLAKERRTYDSRKWVMAKRKKRSQKTMSDSSDKEKLKGITTPHGPTAWGRTHPGGNSKDTCTQRSVSPPATGQPAIHPMDKKTSQTSHQSHGHYTRILKSFNHQTPAIQPPVIGLRKY